MTQNFVNGKKLTWDSARDQEFHEWNMNGVLQSANKVLLLLEKYLFVNLL